MKKMKIFQMSLFLLLPGMMSMNAQVRIGADEDPHAGAVLDLSNANNLGMLLPRVSLDAVGAWTCNGGQNLDGDKTKATGMIVYNTSAAMVNGYGAGIYVWDGSKWNIAGSGAANPFLPDDYETPDNTTYKPSMSGVTCIDVRAGQADPGTQQYVISENGSQTVKDVIWGITQSTEELLISNSTSGTGNTTQSLVFKTQAELLALATGSDQTVTLNAYIEYTDGTKVQLSTTVKIQNRACCPGYLITNGAFEGGPSAVNTGLSVSSTLALFPASTKNLCVGPDLRASKTWNTVSATNWCNTNVHNQGGDWNDGNNDWRLPNIAELANMQAVKGSIPNLATSNYYWSSTDYSGGSSNAVVWYFNGSGNTLNYNKTGSFTTLYTRCVRTIN